MKKDSVTRRNFIATTGTALAGAIIANPFGGIQSKAWTAGKKKRIAIVGHRLNLKNEYQCNSKSF